MIPIRLGGAVLGIACGGYAAYVSQTIIWNTCRDCASTLQQQLPSYLFPLGIALVLVSVATLTGLRVTFAVGAAVAVGILGVVSPTWEYYAPADLALMIVLSLGTLACDLLAFRPSKSLSEQVNPMNLPVFG